jgi:hypothetical protein
MKSSLRLMVGVACISALGASASAQDPPAPRAASIGAREQAVYEALLGSSLHGAHQRQFVSTELGPAPSISDPDVKACAKDLPFAPAPAGGPARTSLAGVRFADRGVELIDPSQWKVHDPGQNIATGKSIDAAVDEGISHSLLSFSQITFSMDGKEALVGFGLVCGSLCGSGSTVRLRESRGRWTVVDHCRNWIS